MLFIGFPNGDAFGGDNGHEDAETSPDEEPSHDMDNLFATGDEIVELLPRYLIVEWNETLQRSFAWGEETFESQVVVVRPVVWINDKINWINEIYRDTFEHILS